MSAEAQLSQLIIINHAQSGGDETNALIKRLQKEAGHTPAKRWKASKASKLISE